MGIFEIIILVVIVVLIFAVVSSRKKDSVPLQNTSQEYHQSSQHSSASEPRDFLNDAEGWLKTPKSLRIMLEEDKEYVLSKLIFLLENGGIYERKYAAFALGQIGEEKVSNKLESCLNRESVAGVREAMGAALVALNMTPASKGYSELERRKKIHEAY